jgi:TatD DNase family protein
MSGWLIDTHGHLSDEALWAERAEVLARARSAGVSAILSVGCDVPTSRRALEWATQSAGSAPAVGIHPTSIPIASPDDFLEVEAMAADPIVAAIGETGLDFYWKTTPEDRQREVFQWHLALAARWGLPVSIHSRSAEQAVLDELEQGLRTGAVLHCFGGDQAAAGRALEMGCLIGVGGPVTFPRAAALHELVRWLPLDRLLLETDCPYLSPHPYRGQRNEPARVELVCEAIAVLKGLPAEEVGRVTAQNALGLFPRLPVQEAISADGIRPEGESK